MATITVDSRGSACPGPITDLARAYKGAANGDVIELLATDEGRRMRKRGVTGLAISS